MGESGLSKKQRAEDLLWEVTKNLVSGGVIYLFAVAGNVIEGNRTLTIAVVLALLGIGGGVAAGYVDSAKWKGASLALSIFSSVLLAWAVLFGLWFEDLNPRDDLGFLSLSDPTDSLITFLMLLLIGIVGYLALTLTRELLRRRRLHHVHVSTEQA